MSDTEIVYLVRYDQSQADARLFGDSPREPQWCWRRHDDHFPWLLTKRTRNQWAKQWVKCQEGRDAGVLLDLMAFGTEALARKYAAECHPGAADGSCGGVMSYPAMTIAEVKRAFPHLTKPQ